jgi:hypothetical protein
MMGGMGRAIDGSYAEYVLVREENVIPSTSDLPWETIGAAGDVPDRLWVGSLTTGLALEPGQSILIRGGTSTVGFDQLEGCVETVGILPPHQLRELPFVNKNLVSRVAVQQCGPIGVAGGGDHVRAEVVGQRDRGQDSTSFPTRCARFAVAGQLLHRCPHWSMEHQGVLSILVNPQRRSPDDLRWRSRRPPRERLRDSTRSLTAGSPPLSLLSTADSGTSPTRSGILK